MDVDISVVAQDVIHEASFTCNLGTPYLGQHSQPLIYTVMRDVFDHFLVGMAQQVGAVHMDRQKVAHVRVSGERIDISTADNVFRSPLVVGVDGTYSVVASELGMGSTIEYFLGIESEIVVAEEELAKWKSRADSKVYSGIYLELDITILVAGAYVTVEFVII